MGELQTTERGVMRRDEFGAVQAHSQAETAMAAVAAREQALVQARFIMAERHQRDWDVVRVRLLKHCDRPGFAEAAWYKKPTGRAKINGELVQTFAEDLSARFMEVARQEIGNLDVMTSVSYEDASTRIINAMVLDLERNNRDSREIVLNKIIEKRGTKDKRTGNWSPPEGREVLSERINSYGEPVYICRATDDEVRQKQNAEISKAQRDETKRLIPADILQDCRDRIARTRAKADKEDPLAARKKVIDSFASMNVMPDELVLYCGCALDKISPAQLDELRGLFTAIRDGEISMAEALRAKYDGEGSREDQTATATVKVNKLKAESDPTSGTQTQPTQEEMEAATREQLAREQKDPGETEQQPRRSLSLPRRQS